MVAPVASGKSSKAGWFSSLSVEKLAYRIRPPINIPAILRTLSYSSGAKFDQKMLAVASVMIASKLRPSVLGIFGVSCWPMWQ